MLFRSTCSHAGTEGFHTVVAVSQCALTPLQALSEHWTKPAYTTNTNTHTGAQIMLNSSSKMRPVFRTVSLLRTVRELNVKVLEAPSHIEIHSTFAASRLCQISVFVYP